MAFSSTTAAPTRRQSPESPRSCEPPTPTRRPGTRKTSITIPKVHGPTPFGTWLIFAWFSGLPVQFRLRTCANTPASSTWNCSEKGPVFLFSPCAQTSGNCSSSCPRSDVPEQGGVPPRARCLLGFMGLRIHQGSIVRGLSYRAKWYNTDEGVFHAT